MDPSWDMKMWYFFVSQCGSGFRLYSCIVCQQCPKEIKIGESKGKNHLPFPQDKEVVGSLKSTVSSKPEYTNTRNLCLWIRLDSSRESNSPNKSTPKPSFV